MYKVTWITYTQFLGMDYYGNDGEIVEDEVIDETYDTHDEAVAQGKKNKYGHKGQLVEVYINDRFLRDYEP